MKLLYRQSSAPSGTALWSFGVSQCYFKHIFTQHDHKGISLKSHYHRDYEIHMVEQGALIYEAEGRNYHLNNGHFLLIPPETLHRVIERAPNTSTFSITFSLHESETSLSHIHQCTAGPITNRIWENIRQIWAEQKTALALSERLIESNILEILALLWRLCGKKEQPALKAQQREDSRLTLAKQYIWDNIEQALTVEDVSSYCHLSTKQLTRLFQQGEEMSLAAYIKAQRVRQMERLLLDGELSLRDISEKMNCSSEYYFNTFFKKNAGMTPGEYRAMNDPK